MTKWLEGFPIICERHLAFFATLQLNLACLAHSAIDDNPLITETLQAIAGKTDSVDEVSEALTKLADYLHEVAASP
jgi:hypothetical protein